jgi:hypothetical protein
MLILDSSSTEFVYHPEHTFVEDLFSL